MPPRLQLTPAVFVCGVSVSFATPSDDFTQILNTLGTLHPLNCTHWLQPPNSRAPNFVPQAVLDLRAIPQSLQPL
jgi:hypothetical protein